MLIEGSWMRRSGAGKGRRSETLCTRMRVTTICIPATTAVAAGGVTLHAPYYHRSRDPDPKRSSRLEAEP